MQGNSGGAARYIPAWVMWVQIIWKVLFPKELLQTAFSAGITDQIKAPGCARIHCWAVFSLTAGTTDVGWICHICSLVRSNHSWLRITAHHGLGIHPQCQPPTQNPINIRMCERAGCASSAGGRGLSWAPVLRKIHAPLQQRTADKQLLETTTKHFKKREKWDQGREG